MKEEHCGAVEADRRRRLHEKYERVLLVGDHLRFGRRSSDRPVAGLHRPGGIQQGAGRALQTARVEAEFDEQTVLNLLGVGTGGPFRFARRTHPPKVRPYGPREVEGPVGAVGFQKIAVVADGWLRRRGSDPGPDTRTGPGERESLRRFVTGTRAIHRIGRGGAVARSPALAFLHQDPAPDQKLDAALHYGERRLGRERLGNLPRGRPLRTPRSLRDPPRLLDRPMGGVGDAFRPGAARQPGQVWEHVGAAVLHFQYVQKLNSTCDTHQARVGASRLRPADRRRRSRRPA